MPSVTLANTGIVRLKHDGTRWRTGGEVKGKLANWVGSQYSHTTSERDVFSITNADAHTSAASSRLNSPPPDLNGLVRFGERRHLVSGRVPSRFKRSLPHIACGPVARPWTQLLQRLQVRVYIQGVPGGMCQTSGGCSLC